jgi:hypothetical protein
VKRAALLVVCACNALALLGLIVVGLSGAAP